MKLNTCTHSFTRRLKGVFAPCLLLTVVAVTTSAARGQSPGYQFIDLHPAGYVHTFARDISAGRVFGYGNGPGNGNTHATLWPQLNSNAALDLNPPGFVMSLGEAASGNSSVGWGYGPATERALLWTGTSSTPVNLHAGAFTHTYAHGVHGAQQVGKGTIESGGSHALLWHGSAATMVDLHPHPATGFRSTVAIATDGVQQVGSGVLTGGGNPRALLWTGNAGSMVDLTPARFANFSVSIDGVSNGQQVGTVSFLLIGEGHHALLWRGSAESVVDLHPAGFARSRARDTNGSQQVGEGYINLDPAVTTSHALLWNGSPDAIDLHQFLPAGYESSIAYGIDEFGNVAGTARIGDRAHAVVWLVPEPTAAALFVGPATLLLRRPRATGGMRGVRRGR